MNQFKEKVVWITGASSGIGAALARAFSREGAIVILSARKIDDLNEVAASCSEKTLVLPLDLLVIDSFEAAVKTVMDTFGKIDVLVNNGGISQRSSAKETILEVDRKIMEVNYFGNIALSKKVLPIMQQQQSGKIIVISSLSGKFGFYLRSAYAASKFALVGFYESLRLEEEKNNIQIHLIFPGFIATNISNNALHGSGNVHNQMDNNQQKGISAETCAKQLLKGIVKNKRDIFIGGKELMALKIQRYFPNLFYKIIKKQSAT